MAVEVPDKIILIGGNAAVDMDKVDPNGAPSSEIVRVDSTGTYLEGAGVTVSDFVQSNGPTFSQSGAPSSTVYAHRSFRDITTYDDVQRMRLMAVARTTDATATVPINVLANGGGWWSAQGVGGVFTGEAWVTAHRVPGAQDTMTQKISFHGYRATSGLPNWSILTSTVTTDKSSSGVGSVWTATAKNNLSAIGIEVKGAAGVNISWHVIVDVMWHID